MKTVIDFKRTTTSEEIESNIEDGLKGLGAILDGLLLADGNGAGTHVWQKESYVALGMIVDNILNNITKTKESVDYMFDLLHEFKNECKANKSNNININIGV